MVIGVSVCAHVPTKALINKENKKYEKMIRINEKTFSQHIFGFLISALYTQEETDINKDSNHELSVFLGGTSK
jgi:hypothetical protein